DLNDGHIKKSVVVPAPNPAWHKLHRNRASLLLADGVVYLGFSSLCEGNQALMHGSITAFDARTLDAVGRYQVTDDATDGGGIGQGSTGLAADTRNNLYFTTGNRRLPNPCPIDVRDHNPPDTSNRANSVVRLKSVKRGRSGAPPLAGEPYTVSMHAED